MAYCLLGRESRGASKDLIFGSPSRPDGHMLYGAFSFIEISGGKTLIQNLEDRGYDITTLQFSVRRKVKEQKGSPS